MPKMTPRERVLRLIAAAEECGQAEEPADARRGRRWIPTKDGSKSPMLGEKARPLTLSMRNTIACLLIPGGEGIVRAGTSNIQYHDGMVITGRETLRCLVRGRLIRNTRQGPTHFYVTNKGRDAFMRGWYRTGKRPPDKVAFYGYEKRWNDATRSFEPVQVGRKSVDD